MKVLYPNGNKGDVLDRNPTRVWIHLNQAAVSPHPEVLLASYTVPPARKCILNSVYFRLYRRTAPTTVGLVSMYLKVYDTLNEHTQWIKSLYSVNVGDETTLVVTPQMILSSGEGMMLYAIDLSVDGTHNRLCSITGLEFDA